MGWTGYRADTSEEALEQLVRDVKLLAEPQWRVQGMNRGCWLLVETYGEPKRPLIVWVMFEFSGGYCYAKEVDESMGPFRHDPPREWLERAPCPGAFGTAWRLRVQSHYACVDIMEARRALEARHA